MSEVKMLYHSDGDYVLYSDYVDALEQADMLIDLLERGYDIRMAIAEYREWKEARGALKELREKK